MRRPNPLLASAFAALLLAATAAHAQAPSAEGALAALQTDYAAAASPGPQTDLYRELFATVLQRVQRSYPSEVDLDALVATARKEMQGLPPQSADPRELFGKAVNAALRKLDPWSRYFDARAYGVERDAYRSSFGGIGLELAPGEGSLRIVASFPGTPAAKAGLQAGDLILRIDDQPLQGVALPDAVAKMRGAPGTQVAITVRRSGVAEDFTVSLTRDTIRTQPVRWSMEGEVLVLQLKTFSGSVTTALRQAIAEATAAHAPRGVVLDLRGNPGGLLREGVQTADTFLSAGEIVTLRGRNEATQRSWQADAEELLAGVPMAVLIDRRSASAAELVAAALQDHGRATVLGQRSFGKGTVQTTASLGEEAKGALKLTTSYYHRPAGPTVQKTGVMPDIELMTAPPGMPETAEAGTPPQARVDPARCSAIYKAADLALACAVGYLMAGNVQGFVARIAP